MTLVKQVFVISVALASPNLELAFLLASGYFAIASMTGGMVSYDNLYHKFRFVQYFSMVSLTLGGLH